MRAKKKLILLSFGALGFILSSTLVSQGASFNDLSIKDKEINVLFKEGKNLNNFKSELNKFTTEYDILDTFNGIVDGVKIKANNSLVNVLKNLPSVDYAGINKTISITSSVDERVEYDLTKTYEEPLENNSIAEMNLPETNNGGEGTLIAVLDSTFTLEHEAFADLSSEIEVKLTSDDVELITQDSEFRGKVPGKDFNYYYNRKIPFYHDYGGTITSIVGGTASHIDDDDVFSPYSNHGMHVSSIATANGAFTGVAPNAQLAFMKVFGDSAQNSNQICQDDMVVNALNDAYLLGADVINMSLGSDLNEFYDSACYKVFEKLANEGVTIAVAAGNEGKGTWRVSGMYANDATSLVEDGIIGNYTNSSNVTGVAASVTSEDTTSAYVISDVAVNGYTLRGEDQYTTMESNDVIYEKDYHFYDLVPEGEKSVSIPYVLVPGIGDEDDFASVGDLTGKIAVVKRGENNFADKVRNAVKVGAVGIVIPNDYGLGEIGRQDLRGLSEEESIPVYSGNAGEYEKLASVPEDERYLTISKTQIADFSSNGATADLRFGPEITAPGQNIAGAINIAQTNSTVERTDTYAYLSGTSMATPNYSGAVSVILGEQNFTSDEEEMEFKKSIEERTMTTATPIFQSNGSPVSVRRQGAGNINIEAASKSDIYLEGKGLNGESAGKFELGNNQDVATGKINLPIKIHNENGRQGSYTVKLYVTAPEITEVDTETDAYKDFVGYKMATTKNVVVGEYETSVKLSGEQIQDFPLSYELSESEKEYLTETFENGTYLEGYAIFEANDNSLYDLSMPFLGFYGDYYQLDAVEPFTFEREEGKLYQSDLLTNLLKVTGANKQAANFSSMIGVTTGGLNGVNVDGILTSDLNPADLYKPIQTKYIDGKYHLYAGALGLSDTLYIQQFVNRSVKDNKIELIDEDGKVVMTDHMYDSLFSSDDENEPKELYKSRALVSLFSENHLTAHRAYTVISLKDRTTGNNYEDGVYTLKFTYQLVNGDTDVKEYVLHINENNEVPEISDVTMSEDKNTLSLSFNEELQSVTLSGKEMTLTSNGSNSEKYVYSINLQENGLKIEDGLFITYTATNYTSKFGILSENGDAILWGNDLQEGGSVSIKETVSETNPNESIYTVNYYNKVGMKMPISKGSSLTLLGTYDSNKVNCFVRNGDAIKKISFSVTPNSITIALDSIDTFIIDKGVTKEGTQDTPENDLTWLWITLGVIGGIVVIGAIGLLVYLLLKKKSQKN